MSFKITLGAALVLLLVATLAAGQESPEITVTRLTDRIYRLSTDRGSYTNNVIASVGSDGVLLVDTDDDDAAGALKKVVERFGRGIPKIIINTHVHVEHVGGNAAWGGEPTIIAHAIAKQRLRESIFLFNEYPDEALPDVTLTDSLSIRFNGERVRIVAIPGAHVDHEIIVHFTDSKVAHVGPLCNGPNFPSIDSVGDVLLYPEAVQRVMDLLPEDVTIVCGHNREMSWQELRDYHEMLVRTTEVVREGLAAGKDVAALRSEKVLADWDAYAGSYVSTDAWIGYLAKGMTKKSAPGKKEIFALLYEALKAEGAEAAIAKYHELKREHPDEYEFRPVDLVLIGDRLVGRRQYREAIPFLEASLAEYPEGPYNWLAAYELARANQERGDKEAAVRFCEKALELNPESQEAVDLLEELRHEEGRARE